MTTPPPLHRQPMTDGRISELRTKAVTGVQDQIQARIAKGYLTEAIDELVWLKDQLRRQTHLARATYSLKCHGVVLREVDDAPVEAPCGWHREGVPAYDAQVQLVYHQHRDSPQCATAGSEVTLEADVDTPEPPSPEANPDPVHGGRMFANKDELPAGLPQDVLDDPNMKFVNLGEGSFMAVDTSSEQAPPPTQRIKLPKEKP